MFDCHTILLVSSPVLTPPSPQVPVTEDSSSREGTEGLDIPHSITLPVSSLPQGWVLFPGPLSWGTSRPLLLQPDL